MENSYSLSVIYFWYLGLERMYVLFFQENGAGRLRENCIDKVIGAWSDHIIVPMVVFLICYSNVLSTRKSSIREYILWVFE